jgi:sugar phosphate isomerase/epimerase
MLASQMALFGFKALELSIRNPFLVDKQILSDFLTKNGLLLSAIGTGQAYHDDGLSLTAHASYKKETALQYLGKHIELASEFGACVIIGLIRGRLCEHPDPDEAYSQFTQAMSGLDAYARKNKVYLVIEPINRYETDFLNTTGQTVHFIQSNHLTNTGILLDTFHMNIEESNLAEAFACAAGYLRHVHLADNQRHCPGSGQMDFLKIFSLLKKIGYQGYVSGEMLTDQDPETTAGRFITYIKEIS